MKTYSFVSLHHLPSGGEHHGRGEQITDVTAVGPHGGVSQQPGGPVLYVENTSHTVLALVVPEGRAGCHLSQRGNNNDVLPKLKQCRPIEWQTIVDKSSIGQSGILIYTVNTGDI